MNVFLDANILVSVVNKEYPDYPHTAKMLSLKETGNFHFYTSPLCLAIVFYFSEKKSGSSVAKKKIEILSSNMSIAANQKDHAMQVAKNKKIHDFEDGLEYYAALETGCKCIVTNDVSDFYFSDIEVLKPEDFLALHAF